MQYSRLNPLEQAAVQLRDCGLVYVTGDASPRFEPLVRLGLAEKREQRGHGTAYRLTAHGRRALAAQGIKA